MHRRRAILVGLLVVSTWVSGCATFPDAPEPAPSPITTAGDTVVVTPPAQKCCKPSILDFLGVPQIVGAFRHVARRIQSRLGARFPGLEPQPPLKLIADPENIDSPYPSVAVAAEVKAEEDAAAQKIKAISYLASLGCSGCYPDVEKALLASLEDCNEGVRYATVVGLRDAAGHPCCCCRSGTCCSPKVLEALEKIAYGMNDFGCPIEPSSRVRRVARLAMHQCSGATAPAVEQVEDIEGPSPADLPPEGPVPADLAAAPSQAARLASARNASTVSPIFAQVKSGPSPDESQRVLAVVHSEPIFEHQIRPRVERRIARAASEKLPTRESIQQLWDEEIDLAIDRKLVCHAARNAGFVTQVAWRNDVTVDPTTAVDPTAPPTNDVPVEDEELLMRKWLLANVAVDENIAPHVTWRRYRTGMSQYLRPAQVRWEMVLAPWSQFTSRQEAWEILSQVRQKSVGENGARLPARAQRTVAHTYDWTQREELPTPQTAQLLFSMQIGWVSPILENEDGCFIVRLLERRAPRTMPMDQALPLIRADILAERRKVAEEAYIASLRNRAHTWKTDNIHR